jgi:hypothetical protein
MEHNSVTSSNQVKTRRVANKPSLDRPSINSGQAFPIISPILVSKAAAVVRRRLRYQKRFEVFALVCLFDFVRHSKHVIHNHPPVDNGFIHLIEGDRIVIYTAEDYYEHMVHKTVSRLRVILEHHQSFLSQQASTVINEVLDWHANKYRQIKKWHSTSLADLIYASSHCRVLETNTKTWLRRKAQ